MPNVVAMYMKSCARNEQRTPAATENKMTKTCSYHLPNTRSTSSRMGEMKECVFDALQESYAYINIYVRTN